MHIKEVTTTWLASVTDAARASFTVKSNTQAVYMHIRLAMNGFLKIFQRKHTHD
jgi:hypothetical protein